MSKFANETELLDGLQKLPVKVENIIVEGVNRTKNDFLKKKLSNIFKAESFVELLLLCEDAKRDLNRLPLFNSINVFIDTCKNENASEHGYDVNFKVVEKRLFGGGIKTTFGDNSGTVTGSFNFPNTFGRGEKFSVEFDKGIKRNDVGGAVRFVKPLNGNPNFIFSAAGYKMIGEYPWSGFRETSRGISMDVTFPSTFFSGTHCLCWDGVWRDLRTLTKTTSFEVREQAGHSLKSSIKHQFQRDDRDNPILPNKGFLFKLDQEFAGLGGNVEFLKHNAELQLNKSLPLSTVLQFTFAGGFMHTFNQDNKIRLNDRFFLGGPLTLRGFNLKGVGPHSEGSAMGADAYWASGLHLYTPLPFSPAKGGFGELFRTHFFINAGNICNIHKDKTLKENVISLSDAFRLAYGAGIVLKMGNIARLELNYVYPYRVQQGDSVNAGLQFGIGVTFL